MSEERLILVDDEDVAVGECEKLEAHREGLLHRAFSVFLFNGEGEFLIQQRADGKYHSGGLWANTACGHPRPGEETVAEAERRLFEEMGVRCELEEFFTTRYFVRFGDLAEHEIVHMCGGFYEGEINPAPEEVQAWKWVGPEELKVGKDEYAFWFDFYLKEHWDQLLEMAKACSSSSAC